MRTIDLTVAISPSELEKDGPDSPLRSHDTLSTRIWTVDASGQRYQARVHHFEHWSMAGTYLDLPGHICDTDDGYDAASIPLERLYRVPAQVIRPAHPDAHGCIGAAALQAACPPGSPAPALVLNALGNRRFDDIPERSVFLGRDAVQWIIGRGVTLLVADVYESNTRPQGVFPMLFRAGVVTVCCPESLGAVRTTRARVTALPVRFCGATQIPCRLVLEEE